MTAQPLWLRGPHGVLVVGMHRSGTSAATRLVNLLGPATCAPQDMVRGPWNPSGHYESRSLMHLNNALLAQMGRRWWYPPPAGDGYEAVAEGITTTRAQARRAFRRVHAGAPWVWKDPRTSVLLPFWRATLGPRILSVVVFRDPVEVARSLQSRHDLPPPFGVALWERYNRLVLAHSAGMPVLVTRYDDLVDDPGAWSAGVAAFLAGEGMALRGQDPAQARAFVDPDLRHATVPAGERGALPAGAAEVLAALEGAAGAHPVFAAPPLGPEPPGVEAELATVGPGERAGLAPAPVGGRGRRPAEGGAALMDLVEASALSGRRHPWEVARARFFLRLLDRLGVCAGTAAWLDVGAGDAWFARQLRAVVPARARVACWDVNYGDEGPPPGADGADGADELAEAGGEGAGPALEFSAERPPGVFDGVLLLDVVEHVEKDVGFVADIVTESLAPGGWVLVSVPAYQSLFSDHDRFLRHVRRYSPGAIRAVVEAAGLRVEARGGLFHSLLPVRIAQAGRERVRRGPVAAGRGPEGVGAWRGGRRLSRALVGALGCDTALSLALATRRTPVVVPGLSTWVFCRRAGEGP